MTDVASEQRSDRRPRVLLLYYTYMGQALPGETSIRRCTFRPSQPRHAGVRLGTTLGPHVMRNHERLRVYERLGRAPDGHKPLANCGNALRHFSGSSSGFPLIRFASNRDDLSGDDGLTLKPPAGQRDAAAAELGILGKMVVEP